MKEETKHNIKQGFETFAVAVVCIVWVFSMHQSCSGLSEKLGKKEEKKEIKKVQEIKNDTINSCKLEQKVR